MILTCTFVFNRQPYFLIDYIEMKMETLRSLRHITAMTTLCVTSILIRW